MSKRGMETQGGEERYGAMGGQDNMTQDDKPRAATAAQLARRKILSAKGKGANARSRQGSPVVGVGGQQASGNPFQSFQPPPSANNFSFNMPGVPTAPTFGSTPAQQNGTSSFGGFAANQNNNNTPSFSFGSNNSQPQQNGTNGTPSFNFGQTQNDNITPSSSFTFGHTQSQELPKTNGFSLGAQPSQPPQNGPTSSFTFEQNQLEQQAPKPSTPSFTGFGQQPQANGDKPVGTGLFGSAPPPSSNEPPKSSGSIFSGLSATSNGVKPGIFTQPPANGDQTPKPSNPFAGFAPQREKEQETPKAAPGFSFGQANKENEAGTPKPTNMFSGFGQQNQQNGEQTPKLSFTGFGQQLAQTNGDETPKPSNPFAGFSFGQSAAKPAEAEKTAEPVQASQPEKPATTFKFGQTQEQQTPKPTSSIFSSLGQTQPSGMPTFKSDAQQQEDTSMMSPGNTPQKQPSAATAPPSGPAQAAEPETPANANAGKSMFDRLSRDPSATASRPSFSFGQTNTVSDTQTPVTGTSLFTPAPPPATAPRPPTILFSQSAAPSATAQLLFSAPTPMQPPSSPKPAAAQLPARRPSLSASTMPTLTSATIDERSKIQELNEGLLAHLRTEDEKKDWSIIFQYYMDEAAKLAGKDAFRAKTTPAQQAPTSATSSNLFSNPPPKPAGSISVQAPAPPGRSSYATPSNVPATPSASNIFAQASKPPATAPVNKKRSADEEPTKDNEPATEKRAKPNDTADYPKLPDNASKTAQLFAKTLEKANKSSNEFGPPDDVYRKVQEQNAAKQAEQQSLGGFNPSTTFKFNAPKAAEPATDKPAETPKAATFGFTPSASTSQAPATGGFKPSAFSTGGSVNFLSAFGKKADSEQEKKRKERMEEDYDSDEEDKATWEAKDKVEQEAKRCRIEEAAKSGPVFTLAPSEKATSSTPFAFKPLGQDKSAEEPASSNAGKSLFDRITPADKPNSSTSTASIFSQTPAKPTFTPSTFGFGQLKTADSDKDKADGEKGHGPGVNTWNPNTPIKFSAPTGKESTTPAAPPPSNPFAGLFGSSATPVGNSDKLAPPSLGFKFGGPAGTSTDVSRATTPGLTTDGETSTGEAEPNEEENDKQVEDMAALMPEEREGHVVIFQVDIAKASKLDDKQTENGTVKGWVERGKGPLYILKPKDGGRARVLLKIPPLGRLAMNFQPLPGMSYKAVDGKKVLTGPFVDHFETNPEKKKSFVQWQIQVKEPKDAAEIARILTEEATMQ